RSSCTRALRLMQSARLSEQRFLSLLEEAAVEAAWALPAIVARHPDGGPNGMPYLFATLESLVRQEVAGGREEPARARHARRSPAHVRRAGPPNGSLPSPEGPPSSQEAIVAPSTTPTGLQPPAAGHPLWPQLVQDLREVLAPAVFLSWVHP